MAAGKLEGKIALITGGDSGIGRAVAYFFAREGRRHRDRVSHRRAEDAEETQRAIESVGQRCLLIPGDVTDSAFCKPRSTRRRDTMDASTFSSTTPPSSSTRNRSRTSPTSSSSSPSARTSSPTSTWRARRSSISKRGGVIINTGSVTGTRREQGDHRLLVDEGRDPRLHEGARAELVEKGIRVNCVAPGPVWTPLNVADKTRRKSRSTAPRCR